MGDPEFCGHKWSICTRAKQGNRLAPFLAMAVVCAATLLLVVHGVRAADRPADGLFGNVHCEGVYPRHLQGICTNDRDSIFWCFTDVLVKTDRQGRMVKKVAVANHHGDLCYQEGKVYVAVNLGKFNELAGKADSWVYIYDATDLSELARHRVPEVVHGAGGIAHHDGRFFLVGGLPKAFEENYVYEYDEDFRFIKRHVINSGYTYLGIQTAAYSRGHWWFGCYGTPSVLLETDADFRTLGKHTFDAALGIVGLPDGSFLVGRGKHSPGTGHTGSAMVADADEKQGLVVRAGPKAGTTPSARVSDAAKLPLKE